MLTASLPRSMLVLQFVSQNQEKQENIFLGQNICINFYFFFFLILFIYFKVIHILCKDKDHSQQISISDQGVVAPAAVQEDNIRDCSIEDDQHSIDKWGKGRRAWLAIFKNKNSDE